MLVLYHLFVLVLIQEGTRAWGGGGSWALSCCSSTGFSVFKP